MLVESFRLYLNEGIRYYRFLRKITWSLQHLVTLGNETVFSGLKSRIFILSFLDLNPEKKTFPMCNNRVYYSYPYYVGKVTQKKVLSLQAPLFHRPLWTSAQDPAIHEVI